MCVIRNVLFYICGISLDFIWSQETFPYTIYASKYWRTFVLAYLYYCCFLFGKLVCYVSLKSFLTLSHGGIFIAVARHFFVLKMIQVPYGIFSGIKTLRNLFYISGCLDSKGNKAVSSRIFPDIETPRSV